MTRPPEIFVPHAGWLRHDADDEVALFLRQGWFEGTEQALAWLYLRPGDVFIDGGAHVGLFSLLAGRRSGRAGVLFPLNRRRQPPNCCDTICKPTESIRRW